MADDWSLYFYNPSVPLAAIGIVVYTIICITITYITLVKYRAWYFFPVVVGAVVEVAGYVTRMYSVKNERDIVSRPCASRASKMRAFPRKLQKRIM